MLSLHAYNIQIVYAINNTDWYKNAEFANFMLNAFDNNDNFCGERHSLMKHPPLSVVT
jgi:hypothetical protein